MKMPPAYARGRLPQRPHIIKATPQLKAREIKRLRDWAARQQMNGGGRDD